METPVFEPLQTRLLLLCRGAVDWTRTGAEGPPLSAQGLLDAELATSTLPRFDAIVASPQRASQETAEAISAIRQVPLTWRDGLDEIRTSSVLTTAQEYADWLDRLFESYHLFAEGESLAEGADRLLAALRATADRYYGRTTLVVGHPVILLAFRASLLNTTVTREQVEALPDLSLLVVDYVEGRFYLVSDFPIRQPTD
ncbi:MAG: histidine phosphatase family protein [Armatimonadota bacterium]|nr:histidine phosphatase family protein [Armatimonadota bacterium]MDR7520475.1 histidine phosphatase family protein [Armatimonadota bacterium]MDR7548521.1 histidine phosphatase family protein [Armatimonadota bacterium]